MRNPFQIIGAVLVVVGLIDIFILPRILEAKISRGGSDQDKEKAINLARKAAIFSGLVTIILGALFVSGLFPFE